jgi:molybdate transport system substrate-binding protein
MRILWRTLPAFTALLLCGCRSQQPAKQLLVGAAADLQFALPQILDDFQRLHKGTAVKATYASSGSFFALILNQAPYDVFLSAGATYPQELVKRGLADEDTLFQYAAGRLVVWVPNSSPIDVAKLGIAALRDGSVHHIAIANPLHAPYGQAAEAAMKSLGVYGAVQEKLVFGENISQTLQFVQSGAAEIGIVALSLASAPAVRNSGRYWEVPQSAYPRLEQVGVIMKSAKDPDTARAFRAFLLSSKAQTTLKQFGFDLPGEH